MQKNIVSALRTPVSDVDANSEQEDTLARRILHMLGPDTVTRTWRGGQIDAYRAGRATRDCAQICNSDVAC
jgi:hypothetical protein